MSQLTSSSNLVHQLINRQSGFEYNISYDHILSRLRVRNDDSWRGITPSSCVSDYNPEPPIFSAKFADCDPYRHILAIANEDGKIALQDTTKRNVNSEEKALTAPQCHYNAIFDLEWQPGEMRFVSASGDHTSRLWDANGSEIRCVTTFLGHTRSVKSAAFRKDDNAVFATGGRDGAIIVWDTRVTNELKTTSRTDNCIFSGHVSGATTPTSQKKRRSSKLPLNMPSSSVTGLVFQDSNTLISCGATDGIIKIWDLRRNYSAYRKEPQPKYSLPYAGTSTFRGYTNLITDRSGSRLYANCMDNTIYCFNISSYDPKPIAEYKGLFVGTFYIKSCLSPDDKYLASGSTDGIAYIWNMEYPEQPLIRLVGHQVEVTCVAWCSTYDYPIVTCSDDARHKIWRISPTMEDGESYNCFAEYKRPIYQRRRSRQLSSSSTDSPEGERKREEYVSRRAKRCFSEANSLTTIQEQEADEDTENSQAAKRPKYSDFCGRNLFSQTVQEEDTRWNDETLEGFQSPEKPSTSFAAIQRQYSTPTTGKRRLVQSNTIEEGENKENHSGTSDEFQNEATKPHSAIQNEDILKRTVVTSPQALYSPTSNLPNFVVDGEAPHLTARSPKKKPQYKMDWLTKMRKQREMIAKQRRSTITLNERLKEEFASNSSRINNDESLRAMESSNDENSSETNTERTLKSTSDYRDTEDMQYNDESSLTATTASNTMENNQRKTNHEMTLLRFFTVQKPNSNVTSIKHGSTERRTEKNDKVSKDTERTSTTTATATCSTDTASTVSTVAVVVAPSVSFESDL